MASITANTAATTAPSCPVSGQTFLQKLNSVWHERGNYIFLAIVLGHWAEHLTQAIQIYVLGWKVPDARGVLGLWYPWLIKSESLHYGYAIVMLAGLWMLRSGFKGKAHTWWMVAFWIQFWHHIEHALLQGQALAGHNLMGKPVPFSVVQFFIPRVELHLFYNTIVFIPMVIATYYHLFPSAEDAAQHECSCAFKPQPMVRLPASRAA